MEFEPDCDSGAASEVLSGDTTWSRADSSLDPERKLVYQPSSRFHADALLDDITTNSL